MPYLRELRSFLDQQEARRRREELKYEAKVMRQHNEYLKALQRAAEKFLSSGADYERLLDKLASLAPPMPDYQGLIRALMESQKQPTDFLGALFNWDPKAGWGNVQNILESPVANLVRSYARSLRGDQYAAQRQSEDLARAPRRLRPQEIFSSLVPSMLEDYRRVSSVPFEMAQRLLPGMEQAKQARGLALLELLASKPPPLPRPPLDTTPLAREYLRGLASVYQSQKEPDLLNLLIAEAMKKRLAGGGR
ncbi:MAG: hypothetical protein QW318_06280 [Candidatus Caldarchaeum sp.]